MSKIETSHDMDIYEQIIEENFIDDLFDDDDDQLSTSNYIPHISFFSYVFRFNQLIDQIGITIGKNNKNLGKEKAAVKRLIKLGGGKVIPNIHRSRNYETSIEKDTKPFYRY